MRRIALTVATLALTVAAGAQAPTGTSSTTQRQPSSSLLIYFDQTDTPANLSYSRGAMTVKARAQSVTLTQLEGQLTVKMRGGGAFVITTALGDETKNFTSAILYFDSKGDLIRYSTAE